MQFLQWFAAWYKILRFNKLVPFQIYKSTTCHCMHYSLLARLTRTLFCKLFLLTNQSFHVFCIFCKELVYQNKKLSWRKLGLWYSFVKKKPKKQAVILLFQTEKWREKERRIEREITIYYHKKNTKDSIPYDEKTGIVFVYTVWISPMMHSVVTRSVQYVLQRTQRFYILKKKEEDNAQLWKIIERGKTNQKI